MNILIVDDSIDKLAKIVSVIEQVSSGFIIDCVNDCYRAELRLKSKKYDLLIVDLFLPIRKGEDPIPNGGELLIKEIRRKASLIPPSLIIGITQREEHEVQFPSIWKLFYFNRGGWDLCLKEIVEHLSRSRKYYSIDNVVKPTIFVEGESDFIIIKEAISLFFNDQIDSIDIRTEKSAGANWVANQIVIWAHSLHKENGSSSLIKAIGLFDGDTAGLEAINEINRIVKPDSTGARSYKIFKLKADYAKGLIPLFKKGLALPISLEELYSSSFWEFCETQDWLEERRDCELFLKDPKLWNKMTMSLTEFLNSLELDSCEKRYLKVFKFGCKEKAVKYILNQEEATKKEILFNFQGLITDMLKYLNG